MTITTSRRNLLQHASLGGGLSHLDSFDWKPELEKWHDREMPDSFGKADAFFGKVGRIHKPHYAFKQRGKSGLWVSDLFPKIAEVADELTVVRSMVAETANHIPGIFQANTGFRQDSQLRISRSNANRDSQSGRFGERTRAHSQVVRARPRRNA